mmetsp:Transcript_19959/g.50786  ORF Transcript_19959/g.50786 Transcript_19959/m.50786 type:complete len:225 (+) Transcript_19959:63-737(+)
MDVTNCHNSIVSGDTQILMLHPHRASDVQGSRSIASPLVDLSGRPTPLLVRVQVVRRAPILRATRSSSSPDAPCRCPCSCSLCRHGVPNAVAGCSNHHASQLRSSRSERCLARAAVREEHRVGACGAQQCKASAMAVRTGCQRTSIVHRSDVVVIVVVVCDQCIGHRLFIIVAILVRLLGVVLVLHAQRRVLERCPPVPVGEMGCGLRFAERVHIVCLCAEEAR